MSAPELVIFGDSIPWGQGLLDQHKFSTLVANGLAAKFPGITPNMSAHSGAVIGPRDCGLGDDAAGEVPVSCPTILGQVNEYAGDPSNAPVVLVNGGINDIDIRVLLNPLTDAGDLTHDIKKFCFDQMLALLTSIKTKFPAPTIIVVTSYYPILSTDSDPIRIPSMLAPLGLMIPNFLPLAPIIGKIISLCLQFWHESEFRLQQAVAAANGSDANPRVRFAVPPFTEQNSVFASTPWLWGLDEDFSAQDEVVDQRHPQCDARFPLDLFMREQCYRASAGHPNVTGAQQFASAILNVI